MKVVKNPRLRDSPDLEHPLAPRHDQMGFDAAHQTWAALPATLLCQPRGPQA